LRHLLTGSSGFICSHICRELSNQIDSNGNFINEIWGVDDYSGSDGSNLHDLIEKPNFHFIRGDCGDYSLMEEIFQRAQPDIVWALSANAREGASIFDPVRIVRTNIMASTVVFELAVKYGASKILFFSSMSVAGDNTPPFSESQPRRPVDPYGICKAGTEHILETIGNVHGMRYTIIRPHNCVGIGQAFDIYRNVLTIFCNRIMRHEPLYLFGRNAKRAFSPIRDSLPAYIRASDLDTANGEIIYVGGSEPITIDELADEVIKNMPEYPVPERIYLPPRPLEVENAFCQISKSQELLGYEEKQGWRDCVREVAEWCKSLGPQPWKYMNDLPLRNARTPIPWVEALEKQKGAA